ncbi:MAG TPA: ABC transporter substrate-binding protein [Nitrososphaerales archaeon]|nr:ABC transporter substrate-binding protein [Nitrososphaerales archaeon]
MKDNTLVYEGAANYEYLDPQVSYFSYDYGILENSYEALMWWNGTNSAAPIPWLASNITQVNPHTWVVGLRQGIAFQDGTPFNSTAVCFTFNRLLVMDAYQPTGSPSGSGWIIQQLVNTALFTALGGNGTTANHSPTWVDQVLAENFCQPLGTYKVQFNLVNPTSSFPVLIAGTWSMIISPSFVIAHDDPTAISNGVANYTAYYDHTAGNGTTYLDNSYQGSEAGTGPYHITSVNPTTYEIKLEANPNYWGGPPGYMYGTIHPSIQYVDIQVVTDQTTRILDLEGGTATGVGVNPDSIFSLLSRNAYDANGSYISDTPGVVFHGPYPYYNTGWVQFNVNVTNSAGQLLSFQPFADQRFRLAVEDSANVTDVLDSVTYGLDQYANWMFPPGTLPAGSDTVVTPPAYSYNLTTAEALLDSACAKPLTSFTYYNGTAIPSGVINNSCKGQTVNLYYQAGDTITEKILTEAVGNLNTISGNDNLGILFTPVPVPAGTLYTLAGEHQIYAYWAGWIDDYNWLVDWLNPMFGVTGTYPSWSLYNFTQWNNLVHQGTIADETGNITGLVQVAAAMGSSANENGYYWLNEYQLDYHFLSTWVHGWFYSPETTPNQADYWAVLSFAPPS